MSSLGYGDLARTVPLTRHGVQARADLSRLSQELTTGRHADVAAANRGDLRALSGIERNLAILGRTEATATAVQGRMGAMQAALEAVQTASRDAASAFLTIAGPTSATGMGQIQATAEAALGSALSALSARIGGIHLFSGEAADAPPLPGMTDLLDRLRADVPATGDAAALRAQVHAWFAPGGGLDALTPPGAGEPAEVPVAPDETLSVAATAADPEVRALLAELALGVLAGENRGGALPDAGRRQILERAGTAILTDEAGVTSLRGRLGVAEGQSERALARIRAETGALQIARGEALEVDRYATATKLQAAEAAVETLYLVTARLSGLSLANYLR